MTSPRISVVMPAYNASRYIAEAIQSVLPQTRPVSELIVVDDGSTDDTITIAQRFGDFVRIERRQNGGAAAARNTGAAVASGDWIAFLDADDVWLPDKIERQLALADDQTALIYSDRYNIGDRNGLPDVQGELQRMVEGDVFESLLMANVITTSTVMIRTSVFRELGGFSDDARLPPAEDWDLWLRVVERHTIRVCQAPLVKYRLHLSGISRNAERMNRARLLVIGRALALPRGRALSALDRRRIWSATWLANGFDALRAGDAAGARHAYWRAIGSWPFSLGAYKELVKLSLSPPARDAA